MERRIFIAGSVGVLATQLMLLVLTGPLVLTAAQPPEKMSRVGYLSPGSPLDPVRLRRFEAFREAMRELGYAEGRNLSLETRWAGDQYARYATLAADLVRLKVDVIVTLGGAESPTVFQQRVAAALGIPLLRGDSRSVAAARILDHVGPAIEARHQEGPPTPRQLAFARSIGLDVSQWSRRVASAKIAEALRKANKATLRRLRLKPGDSVLRRTLVEFDEQRIEVTEQFTVSSIHPNGRVYFTGGQGHGAWPLQLEKVTLAELRGRRLPEMRHLAPDETQGVGDASI